MGTPYYQALWHVAMAQVAFSQGHAQEARKLVLTAHRISLSMKSQIMEWYSLLIDAWLLLQEGEETEGLLSLHRGLSLGRRHGYVHLEFYQPVVMRFLFARALEERIEQEYVTGLVRKLGLTPPYPLEEWPYPVKIHTLGRFGILKNDERLLFAGKVPKKPLELLKVLIAFGGGNVPLDKITAALWPEADGDAAYASFKVALHHLRKLLGSDEAILNTQGRTSLNSRYCHVDATEFQRCADEVLKRGSTADSDDGEQHLMLAEKALGMYLGNFLPDDDGFSAGAAMRERLRSRFARLVELAGRLYGERKEWHNAVELYEKGIETDELQEEFYTSLMLCYRELGRPGAAAAVYDRCRGMLRDHFNVAPSASMKALYAELVTPR